MEYTLSPGDRVLVDKPRRRLARAVYPGEARRGLNPGTRRRGRVRFPRRWDAPDQTRGRVLNRCRADHQSPVAEAEPDPSADDRPERNARDHRDRRHPIDMRRGRVVRVPSHEPALVRIDPRIAAGRYRDAPAVLLVIVRVRPCGGLVTGLALAATHHAALTAVHAAHALHHHLHVRLHGLHVLLL